MKILFITTSYPPYIDMQTIRNEKLIQSLLDSGHLVTVLSPSGVSKVETSYVKNVENWKTKPPFFFRFTNFLEKKIKNKFLLKLVNVFGGTFLFPDIFAFWSIEAIKFLNKKDVKQFNLFITSSGSFTSHFIGAKLSKKTGVSWVADYGDPWSLDKYGKTKFFVKYFETRVLKNCSLVFFTTKSTINFYKSFLNKNSISKKMILLPCGYDDMSKYYCDFNNDKKKIITYTGVAYSKDRDLTNAILAVGEKSDKVSLNIVGSYSSKYEEILNNDNSVKFEGRVSYEESLKIINESNILLHIGNFGVMQIPGKTYIYLATPRPIIYIRQEQGDDPTYNLLQSFKGILIVNNNKKDIYNAIEELYLNYNYYLELSKERVRSFELEKYMWSNICNVFNQTISSYGT